MGSNDDLRWVILYCCIRIYVYALFNNLIDVYTLSHTPSLTPLLTCLPSLTPFSHTPLLSHVLTGFSGLLEHSEKIHRKLNTFIRAYQGDVLDYPVSAVLRRDIIGDLISEQGEIKASTIVPSTASFFPLLRIVGEPPPAEVKIDASSSKSTKLSEKQGNAAGGEEEEEEGSGEGEEKEAEMEEEEEEEEEGEAHSGIDDHTLMILASVTTIYPSTPTPTTNIHTTRYTLTRQPIV